MPAAPAAAAEGRSLSLIHTAKLNHPKSQEDSEAWEARKTLFERRKRQGLKVAAYGMSHEARDTYAEMEGDLLWRAHRQEECGNYLVLRQAIEGDDNQPRIHRASLCGLRWTCPFCAAQLGAKKAAHYSARLAELRLAEDQRRCYFFTLTVPNGPDLVETYGKLNDAFKKLHIRYQNAKRRKNGSTFQRIVGQLGQFEIKRGKDSGWWHPHYHGVFITNGRLDYAEFRQAWADAVGDEKTWCKVLLLDTEKRLMTGQRMELDELRSSLMKDLNEVIKYPHKIDTKRPEDAWFCWSVLGRSRMTRTWGEVRHKSFEELTDEPIDWDQVAFIERMLCWSEDRYDEHDLPGTPQPFEEFADHQTGTL